MCDEDVDQIMGDAGLKNTADTGSALMETLECESHGPLYLACPNAPYSDKLSRIFAIRSRYLGADHAPQQNRHDDPLGKHVALFAHENPEDRIMAYGCDRPDWRIVRMGPHMRRLLGDYAGKRFSELEGLAIISRCAMLLNIAQETGELVYCESIYRDRSGQRFQLLSKYFSLPKQEGVHALGGCHLEIRALSGR